MRNPRNCNNMNVCVCVLLTCVHVGYITTDTPYTSPASLIGHTVQVRNVPSKSIGKVNKCAAPETLVAFR